MWNNIDKPKPRNLNKITIVNITCRKLTKIPDWICECNNLRKLNCSWNKITQIPYNLPNSLEEFNCSGNQITQIPNTLPNSLQIFKCSFNEIEQIPNALPKSLEILYCYHNQTIFIPLSIIQLQNLTRFDYNINSKYEIPLVKYFLNDLNNKEIKQHCYNMIWKARMEF